MPKSDFLPKREADLNEWLRNFSEKSTAAATSLGIAAADVKAVQTVITTQRTAFTTLNTKRDEAKAATRSYQTSKNAMNNSVRALVRRFKASPAYTPALGAELGIIGPEDVSARMAVLKPVLTISFSGGKVTIAFKKGKADGIRLYCKRGTETAFSFLDIDMSSPYQDTRPNLVAGQAETRQYQAYYFKSDEQIGEISDVVSIAVL